MDLFEIGELVKERRKSMKITQSELAEKAGVSRLRVSQLETGSAFDIKFGNLMRILEALDLDFRLTTANQGRPTLDDLQEEEERYDRQDVADPGF